MSTDSRTPEEIERDIQRERAQLSSSLEALQERFSIEGITRQVADQLKRHGSDFGQSALESAKSNPVALALTGVGLVWMMASDARRSGSHGDSASPRGSTGTSTPGSGSGSERWDRMKADASWYGHRARASAEDLRSRLHEGTEHLSDSARKRVVEAREAAYQAQSQIERTAGGGSKQLIEFYREQPIVAGAMALAFGAALGALLPSTETEDSAFGETSDRLFEEAERIFKEETGKAKERVKSPSSKPDVQGRKVQGRRGGREDGRQNQPKI
jgi:hypothetical protein